MNTTNKSVVNVVNNVANEVPFELETTVIDSATCEAIPDSCRLDELAALTQDVPLRIAIAHAPEAFEEAKRYVYHIAAEIEKAMPRIRAKVRTLAIDVDSVHKTVQRIAAYEVSISSAIQLGHSFIVTHDWTYSEVVINARRNYMIRSKQLFALTGDPAPMIAKYALQMNPRTFGGVFSNPVTPERYLDSLNALQPGVDHVCLAYTDASLSEHEHRVIEENVASIVEHFEQNNVKVSKHAWTTKEAGMEALADKMATCKAVITLNEPAADAHHKKVVGLCNTLNKPHEASTHDQVFNGSAIGHGHSTAEYCAGLVSVLAVMVSDIHILTGSEDFMRKLRAHEGARYNQYVFELQGLLLSRQQSTLLHMKSVYED